MGAISRRNQDVPRREDEDNEKIIEYKKKEWSRIKLNNMFCARRQKEYLDYRA